MMETINITYRNWNLNVLPLANGNFKLQHKETFLGELTPTLCDELGVRWHIAANVKADFAQEIGSLIEQKLV